MKNLFDIYAILKLKEKGLSNRKIANTLGINIKTVNKYWNEYKENLKKLGETDNVKEILNIQENIVSKPKYNSENRVRRKVTPEFLNALEKILEDLIKMSIYYGFEINVTNAFSGNEKGYVEGSVKYLRNKFI